MGVVTVATAWVGGGPVSALRHLYVGPTLLAALRSGATGGFLIGIVAGLVQAPLVFPWIEATGLTPETLDGLVSLVTPLSLGTIVGRLRDQARARASRLAALLEVQRGLGRDGPLEARLRAAAGEVRAAFRARSAALLVSAGDGITAVGSAPGEATLDGRSAAAWVLATGRALTVRDAGTDPRLARAEPAGPTPIRGLVLPLDSGRGVVGALALEWAGDPPPGSRLAAEETAVHLALAVENARLELRQRGFARELEDKVAAATARLRELDLAKSEFLSIVSHELRTPLTALGGFSELLLSRTVPPARATRMLEHMHTEARRLGRIVTQLLDLSRIEAGRPETLRPEAVDLAELVERNVELFAAEHHRHRFEWAPPEAPAEVRADADALDRVLKNLLSNAVKYSPRGGAVRVTAGPAAERPGWTELAVEDEGVGIPAAALPTIFDKYVRVADPETTGTRGLGLGLSLVRALVEAHGGAVEVRSEPGRGSRFRVLLPS